MLNDNHFVFFSNCLIVDGAKRSLICDLQKNRATLIPNDLRDIVDHLNTKSIDSVYKKYDVKNRETIDEYLSFLVDNEYGFFCSQKEKKFFPKMNTECEMPSTITNAIIEIKELNYTMLNDIIKQLDELKCQSVHFFFYTALTEEFLLPLSDLTIFTVLQSIEITAKYSPKFDFFQLEKLNKRPNKILSFHFYSANENESNKYGKDFLFGVSFSKILNLTKLSCGKISKDYFFVTKNKVLESINHNSCLYKKIGVDVDGNIKNCPSMSKSYGNIKDTTLLDALNKKGFKEFWGVTKDKIEVCKDCEFRHICTDCRAYTEQTHSEGEIDFSKPLKCGYNPYTNEWTEWSTSALKNKAIKYYGMQDLIKQHG